MYILVTVAHPDNPFFTPSPISQLLVSGRQFGQSDSKVVWMLCRQLRGSEDGPTQLLHSLPPPPLWFSRLASSVCWGVVAECYITRIWVFLECHKSDFYSNSLTHVRTTSVKLVATHIRLRLFDLWLIILFLNECSLAEMHTKWIDLNTIKSNILS